MCRKAPKGIPIAFPEGIPELQPEGALRTRGRLAHALECPLMSTVDISCKYLIHQSIGITPELQMSCIVLVDTMRLSTGTPQPHGVILWKCDVYWVTCVAYVIRFYLRAYAFVRTMP